MIKEPRRQDPAKIRYVTIHTTASALGKALTAEQVSRIDQQIFGQTSYHHVIELGGRTVQTLRHDQIGAHVGNHNTGNIGVSYVGGLGANGKGADTRTLAQKAAMEIVINGLVRLYPGVKILGHRDWSPDKNRNGRVDKFEWLKECPCFDVPSWLESIGLGAYALRGLPV